LTAISDHGWPLVADARGKLILVISNVDFPDSTFATKPYFRVTQPDSGSDLDAIHFFSEASSAPATTSNFISATSADRFMQGQ
jgi:hypothetical protein